MLPLTTRQAVIIFAVVVAALLASGAASPAKHDAARYRTCQVDAATANRFAAVYNEHLTTLAPEEKHQKVHQELERDWQELKRDPCW